MELSNGSEGDDDIAALQVDLKPPQSILKASSFIAKSRDNSIDKREALLKDNKVAFTEEKFS